VATRLAGKRHPEQGQIGGHEKRDTGAASQRPARSWPSGRPLEARSNPGPREMTAAIVRKDGRHRIRLIARLPRALKKGTGALRSLSPFYVSYALWFNLDVVHDLLHVLDLLRNLPSTPPSVLTASLRHSWISWVKRAESL